MVRKIKAPPLNPQEVNIITKVHDYISQLDSLLQKLEVENQPLAWRIDLKTAAHLFETHQKIRIIDKRLKKLWEQSRELFTNVRNQ